MNEVQEGRELVGQLIHAAQHGTMRDVELILRDPRVNNATLDHFGLEALQLAVMLNRNEIALCLIQHPRIQAGRALRHVRQDNPDIIRALLNHPTTSLENIRDAIRTAVDERRDTQLQQILRDPRTRLHELRDFFWNQINHTAVLNMYLNDHDKNKSVLNILSNHWTTYFPDDPLPENAMLEYMDNLYRYKYPTPEKTWARRRHALLLWHFVYEHECE